MRKFLFSMLLVAFLSPLALNADELIVGEATKSAATVPFRNLKKYSWVQSIYPSSELGQAMTITNIAYNCATIGQTTTGTIKVYMGETTKETHANAEDWVQNLTLVYTGTGVTLGDEEWENFTLNTSYNYSGTQNLVIAVSTSLDAVNLQQKWNLTEVQGKSPCFYNAGSNTDATYSEPATNTTMGSLYSSRPVLKITTSTDLDQTDPENPGVTPDPDEPETLYAPNVTAAATSSTKILLSWNSVADSALYKVYFASEWIGETYNTSFVVNNCYPSMQHCFTVVATKKGVESDASAPACATTLAEDPEEPGVTPDPEEPGVTPDPEDPADKPTADASSFYDDFNYGPNKTGWENWTRIDKDGDGNQWNSTQYGSYSGYDETYGIYSACYATGVALTPDNYIITKKPYTITATSAFSFVYREADATLYQENFAVVVSEDGENFTEIWRKKYTEADVHEAGVWGKDSISLAEYAGKDLFIGFRHYDCNGNTASGIKIDNVRLSTEDSDGTDSGDEGELPEIPTEGAVTIVIGEDGTLSSFYVPINDYYNQFGISQQIYTAEELGAKAGTVVSLSFKKANAVSARERNVKVYLKNTDKEYYAGTYDWVTLTSEDVAVFEGKISVPSTSEWVTINFTRPFEYTGGNIALTINDVTGGYVGVGASWASYETEEPRAIYSVGLSEIDHLLLDSRNGVLDASSNKYMNSQVKFAVVPAKTDVEIAESIDLGNVALGEYWSEKASVKVAMKAVNTTITNITVDNAFFVLPTEIDYTASVLEITYDRTVAAGVKEGNLTITYGEGETKVVPITATAYEVVKPDVFELAEEVVFTEGVYTNTPDFAALHDNYLLPQEKEDGKTPDAVYAVEFTDDALVTASVTGTNAVLAVYKSDFNGEDGPSANNYYDGVLYTPRSFFFDFNDGTFNGWTLIDNNEDGYNWEIIEEDDMKYAKSYAHKTQGEGETKIDVITSANNVMMTEQVYNITANSQLSFDALRYSHESFDDSETMKEYVRVEVSKDGETFTMIEKVLPAARIFGTSVVNLGAKFAELGLNYGDYHIALRHQEIDGEYVSVDNVKLANVVYSKADTKSIDAVHFPAGKYYFIAAAETAFSVNIEAEAAPLTPPTEIVATNVTETTVTLSWNEVAKAESYNVYKNETLVTNVTETTCTIEGLQSYTDYSFVIKSVAGEDESFASEKVVVKTKDLVVGMPSNLKAEALSKSEILLTWEAAENALAYNVYKIKDDITEKIATVGALTYTATGLEANQAYFFAVSAVRNEQESEMTKKVFAITEDLIPGAPANLKATTIDATTIGLTWEAGVNAIGYNIYRDGALVGNSSGTSYVDRELTQGTEYCYTVRGVRGSVESAEESNQACATTGGVKPTAPVAPTNLKAKALSTSSIELTWNPVGNAKSYNVYKGEEKIATVELPKYTVEGLEYDTEYAFTVTAVNEVGESEKSTEVKAKTLGESLTELASSINIYPNPVNDKLFIKTEMEVLEVSVYDVYGRKLSAVSYQQSVVDVAGLNSGVYFVKVKTDNGETIKRFVKK